MENWSPWLDLKIVLLTPLEVLRSRAEALTGATEAGQAGAQQAEGAAALEPEAASAGAARATPAPTPRRPPPWSEPRRSGPRARRMGPSAAMEDPMPIARDVAIPLREVVLRASRSSGPGGQHANVTASRVEASFDVAASRP